MERRSIIRLIGFLFFLTTTVPLIAPIFFSFVALITKGRFLYDFLMPAELFAFTMIGALGMAVILILNRTSPRRLLIVLLLSALNLIVSQIYANLTGLAHGETELAGIHLFMVIVFIVLYHVFALLVILESFTALKRI